MERWRGVHDESTFYQSLSVPVDFNSAALDVDSTARYACLGGRKCLIVVDLEAPTVRPRRVQIRPPFRDLSFVAWNPSPSRPSLLASIVSKSILIWSLEEGRTKPLRGDVTAHTRPISHLHWNPHEVNEFATSSADKFIKVWDIRQRGEPVKMFNSWTSGVSMVRWNSVNPLLLVSNHEHEVRVWDIRKPKAPTTYITAHMSKVNGVDWHPTKENCLVTCSQDKLVKFWDTNSPKECVRRIQTGTPVGSARYTPFGEGVIVMSALRGHNDLQLYSLKTDMDTVKQFAWRIRGKGAEEEYQLVSIGKDQTMRLWGVAGELQERCGHAPSVSAKTMGESFQFSHSPLVGSPVEALQSTSTSTPFKSLTLGQEFAVMDRDIAGVKIEKMDSAARILSITLAIRDVHVRQPMLKKKRE